MIGEVECLSVFEVREQADFDSYENTAEFEANQSVRLCALFSDFVLFDCKLDKNYQADVRGVVALGSMNTGSVVLSNY